MTGLVALSPYPIPAALQGRKVVNLGDGFILRAIERLFGRFAQDAILSPRVQPTPEDHRIMAGAEAVVLAGANQLNDRYTVWPGLTASQILQSGLRLVPVGVGIHGEAPQSLAMSESTQAIVRAIHASVPFTSWRCPLTVSYLERSLPDLKGRFLMTGCPVLFDKPLLTESRFHTGQDSVAITVTDRGTGWWDRERATLAVVRAAFPSARCTLILHQDFSRLSSPESPSEDDRLRLRLREEAAAMGIHVVVPRDADEAISIYQGADLHFGSRLHAHLLMLSLNKRSVVTGFDDRTRGMSQAFGFPVLSPERLLEGLDCDFETIRDRALAAHDTLLDFVRSLDLKSTPAITPYAHKDDFNHAHA